jgi:hypothetical protein
VRDWILTDSFGHVMEMRGDSRPRHEQTLAESEEAFGSWAEPTRRLALGWNDIAAGTFVATAVLAILTAVSLATPPADGDGFSPAGRLLFQLAAAATQEAPAGCAPSPASDGRTHSAKADRV